MVMRHSDRRFLNILGTRGIPASHGGFESFVHHFAPYMKNNGWNVTVYCQAEEGVNRPTTKIDEWNGISRVHISTRARGTLATVEFDLRAALDVISRPGIDLVLGYNTAVFNSLSKLRGRKLIMNMDGIEWKRQKWGGIAKSWFWLNEWIGLRISDRSIADHPEIAKHLVSRGGSSPVVIPYGANRIEEDLSAKIEFLKVTPRNFFVTIARVEPENSILELVQSFIRADIDAKLVVLGTLQPRTNAYHASVMQAAAGDDRIIFPGAIYDADVVSALRAHCIAYLHGHQVGGTNPSLVEALGAGAAVIAHDNLYNRWTAGPEQYFFVTIQQCSDAMRRLASNPDARSVASSHSRQRHSNSFTYDRIHSAYRKLLEHYV